MPQSNTADQIGQQLTELSIAAPQVIAHRINRLSVAGMAAPADWDEWYLMGSEKVAAFVESWQAIGVQSAAFQKETIEGLAAMFWRPWSGGLTVARVAEQALLAISTGLAPVHRRAVANARRLARDSGLADPAT